MIALKMEKNTFGNTCSKIIATLQDGYAS